MYLGKTVRQFFCLWLFSLPPIRAPLLASEFEIYSHHTWLPCSPLSSQEVSEVFQSILNPEVMRFLHKRIQHSKSSEQNSLYWSFDTTSTLFFTPGETIRKTAYGYSKENPELPQLNLGLIVSENSGRTSVLQSSGRFNF